MKNFINEDKIFDILEETQSPSSQRVKTIINKSLELKGLNPAVFIVAFVKKT
jgi:hypothetical protein